jgi:AraC family transcriptional regulator of adaptative response/methylated-DNA-[protein]-cysteine methyltransferase
MVNTMNEQYKETKLSIWKTYQRNADKQLFVSFLHAKVGPMVALADHEYLYLLDFFEGRHLDRHVKAIIQETQSTIVEGKTVIHERVEQELQLFCEGKLQKFTIPLSVHGTLFQKAVWQQLQKIPFGSTMSYGKVATLLQKPKAFRAVAQANSANKIALIIPCHRVINENGKLGGYSGGLSHKQWLLEHERDASHGS